LNFEVQESVEFFYLYLSVLTSEDVKVVAVALSGIHASHGFDEQCLKRNLEAFTGNDESAKMG